jgi:hypothetical protein
MYNLDTSIYIFYIMKYTLFGVFFLSFIGKIRRISDFEDVIRDFNVVNLHLVSFSARFVLFLEFMIIFLLFPNWDLVGFGAVLSFVLLLIFTTLLLKTVFSRGVVSCGCFGAANKFPINWGDVIRNLLLIAVSTYLWLGKVSLNSAFHAYNILFIVYICISLVLLFSYLSDIYWYFTEKQYG